MQRRKSTIKINSHYMSKDPLRFNKLFHNKIETDIQKSLSEELKTYKEIIDYDFNPQYKKKQLLKSYDKAQKLDNIKFQSFSDLGLKKEDRPLLENVRFVKIINQLKLVFISCNNAIIVFDRDSQTSYVLRFKKDSVNCLDFDPVSGAFIFGHEFGKFSFYKWEKKSLKRLDYIKLEGFTTYPIKFVRFAAGVDVIVFLDQSNSSQLLIRVPGKKIKYKNKCILESKSEHFELASIRLGNGNNDESNLGNSVIISYSSLKDVKFICFETVFEKNAFRDITNLRKIHKVARPTEEIQDDNIDGLFDPKSDGDTNNSQNNTQNSDSLNEQGSSFSKGKPKTIVLFDNKQYLLENQPYVIVIWGNIVQQFFITPDLCFVNSFTFRLKDNIIGAYIASTELLSVVFDNYQVSFVYLEKLRYTLDNNNDNEDCIEHKETFTNRGERDVLGLDTLNKAACLFSNGALQYFQIFNWENYIENLKAQSFYIEALFLLSKLVKGIPTHLAGVLFPEARGVTFTLTDIQDMRNFTEDLKETVGNIMSDMIEWLRNKKHAINLLELCIELLVKTRNFDLIYTDFLDVILTSKNNNDQLAEVFIKQLASYMNDKILNEYFSIDFFVKIFKLIDNNDNITILDRFLFFIVQNFTLKTEIFEILKIMAFNKKMPIFSFFLLLHNPKSEDNLNYMRNQIEELTNQIPIDTNKLRKLNSRLFAYVYDLFTEGRFFDLGVKTRKNKTSLKTIREITKTWFLRSSNDFFLKHFGQKTVFLLLKIHKFYMKSVPGNIIRRKPGGSIVIENVQTDFNEFFINITDNNTTEIYKPLCLFIFLMTHGPMRLTEGYIEKVVLSILSPPLILKLDSNKNISFDYFLNYFFDFYYILKNDLKHSSKFKAHLETNKKKQ